MVFLFKMINKKMDMDTAESLSKIAWIKMNWTICYLSLWAAVLLDS